jgi:hypothetical protein
MEIDEIKTIKLIEFSAFHCEAPRHSEGPATVPASSDIAQSLKVSRMGLPSG